MPLVSLTMVLLMGICLYAALNFLFYFKYSYKTRSADTLYLIFSGMCFLVIGYMVAELITYQSRDSEIFAKAFKWRLVFGLLFMMIWPWFAYRYTFKGPRRLLAGLSAYLGLHWLLNLLLPYGVAFDELPALVEHTLPWGETVTFAADSHTNVRLAFCWIGIIAVVVYGFYACFWQYRRGQRRRAMMLAIATAVFTSFLAENMLVVAGVLDFVLLAQFGFPAFIVIMGAVMHREAYTRAWRIQSIVDHVPAVVYLKDMDGRYLLVNRQYESLFQVNSAKIVGRTDIELYGKDHEIFQANDRAALKSGNAMEIEEIVRHPDGTFHTYRSIKFPIHDADNESYALCSVSSDVTESKRAQEQIAQSESKFRTLFESAGDAILLMREGRFIDCNPHALTMFGCTNDDIVGNTLMAFSPPSQYDGRDSTAAALEKINAALEGTAQFFPWHHRRLDSTLFDAEVSLKRIELQGQSCLQAIVRDVTARKSTEEAIKNIAAGVSAETGEAFFRQLVIYLSKLFDTKYSFIGRIDGKDTSLVNTLALCVDGVIADNIIYHLEGTPCADVVGKHTCAYSSGVQQAFPEDILLQQLGVESYIGTPLFDSVGTPLGLIVLLDDKPRPQIEWLGEILQIFAARAVAELERLRTVQDLFIKDRAMEAATEGIVLMDASRNNAIVYANRAMELITGYPREELLGQSLQLLQGSDSDPGTIDELRTAIKRRQPYQAEILNYRKDGTSFWNEITITPVRNDTGEVTHFIGTQTDISQRRQTEDALRRSQKMEALGQMAGGIAHDFNNQLGIIIGYLDFLGERLAAEEKPRKWVEIATQSTMRCIDLTRQLLSFSRRQTKEKTIIDLNQELTRMDALIARSVTPAITVRINACEGLWPVAVNPGEFQDVVLNLVINARDAMPDGGQLLIKVSNKHVNKPLNKSVDTHYVSLDPELPPGDYVQVTVSDNGHGMDKHTLERVFEPFFTTKPDGKGTGLGLAMVYGFTRRYGGEIKVESGIGTGTVFRLYLPRVCELHAATRPEFVSQSSPGGSETILVVDDEADLLQLSKQYLNHLGYHTLTANNSAEALKLLARHSNIDLLFSDVVMPGDANGYALAEQAVKLRPGLKILLTSGYSAGTVAAKDQASFAKHFLRKPYRQDDLAQCIRDVLDQTLNDDVTDSFQGNDSTVNLVGRTILVVDDDKDIRDLFKLNLEKLGCKTISARNGNEAISLYKRSLRSDKPIDAIILDLNFSTGLDGRGIAAKIRLLDPKARLILTSGQMKNAEMSFSRDHGFQGVLEKDFNREIIQQVLTRVLSC